MPRSRARLSALVWLVVFASVSASEPAGRADAPTQVGRAAIAIVVLASDSGDPLQGVRVAFRNLDTGRTEYLTSRDDGRCPRYLVVRGTRLRVFPSDPRYVFDDPPNLTLTVQRDQEFYFKGASVAAVIAKTPVFRLQVAVTTDTRTNDETDDDVWVSFTPPAVSRQTDAYFLDSPEDDFERNAREVFDVPPSRWGIRTIADITSVSLGVIGTDGWCFGGLALIVNGDIWIPLPNERRCVDEPSDPFGGVVEALAPVGSRTSFAVRTDPNTLRVNGPTAQVTPDLFLRWQRVLAGEEALVIGAAELRSRMAGAVGHRLKDLGSLRWDTLGTFSVRGLRDGRIELRAALKKDDPQFVFPFGDVNIPDRVTYVGTYEIERRLDAALTVLELIAADGPGGVDRLFSVEGAGRVELFRYGPKSAVVASDGSLRIQF